MENVVFSIYHGQAYTMLSVCGYAFKSTKAIRVHLSSALMTDAVHNNPLPFCPGD